MKNKKTIKNLEKVNQLSKAEQNLIKGGDDFIIIEEIIVN